MGMFDSIKIDIKCPTCGNESEKEAQTKELECNLEVWRKGDFVTDKYNYIGCLTDCKCGESFYVDVKLDKGVVTGEYELTSNAP